MPELPTDGRLRLEGRFVPERLRRFAVARAGLLGIEIRAIRVSPSLFETELHGAPSMLGAFEMACLLGPGDG